MNRFRGLQVQSGSNVYVLKELLSEGMVIIERRRILIHLHNELSADAVQNTSDIDAADPRDVQL